MGQLADSFELYDGNEDNSLKRRKNEKYNLFCRWLGIGWKPEQQLLK